jgi:AraC-like DNA-binding protein
MSANRTRPLAVDARILILDRLCDLALLMLEQSQILNEQAFRVEAHAQVFMDLIASVVKSLAPLLRQINKLPAKNRGIRVELFWRVYQARYYIHSIGHEVIQLSELAAAASLSPYHCARAFRLVMGESPYAYLNRLRLGKASSLIRETELSILRINQEVGFESSTSFSGLFKRIYGLSLSEYRLQGLREAISKIERHGWGRDGRLGMLRAKRPPVTQ